MSQAIDYIIQNLPPELITGKKFNKMAVRRAMKVAIPLYLEYLYKRLLDKKPVKIFPIGKLYSNTMKIRGFISPLTEMPIGNKTIRRVKFRVSETLRDAIRGEV
jgi:nucleoid DNA-binding protein